MEEFVILGVILYLLSRKHQATLPGGFEIRYGTLTSTTRSLIYTNTTEGYRNVTVRNDGTVSPIMIYHIIDGVEAYQSQIPSGQAKIIMMNVDNKLYGSSFMTGYNVDYSILIEEYLGV
jgi:hypothetical protein